MSNTPPTIIGNIPKLPAKFAAWIMPLFLSCLMINMLINVGLINGFWVKWLAAWMVSWAVAYPVVLIVLPLVRRLTAVFVDMPK